MISPPPVATWLLNLFAPAEQAEEILGDLVEEFNSLASHSGVGYAWSWYRRQAVKSIAHIVAGQFRAAPWTVTAAVLGGFLLRWFVSRLCNGWIQRAIEGVLDRYQPYEHDPHAYIFWLTNSFLVEHLILSAVIGILVAGAAKGREMTATMALALLGALLAIESTVVTVARTGDTALFGTLPWSFAFSMAIVCGGALVRTRRFSHRAAGLVNPRASSQ